jgi:hypothetical protein
MFCADAHAGPCSEFARTITDLIPERTVHFSIHSTFGYKVPFALYDEAPFGQFFEYSMYDFDDGFISTHIEKRFGRYLSTMDVFVCSMPVRSCTWYTRFNRPIIHLAVFHFFYLARTGSFGTKGQPADGFGELASAYKRLCEDARNVCTANSRWSSREFAFYANVTPAYLPSLAMHIGDTEYTSLSSNRKVLVNVRGFSSGGNVGTCPNMLLSELNQKGTWTFSMFPKFDSYRYESLLSGVRAAVFFPYVASSFAFQELYAMGVPILVPSMELALRPPTEYKNCISLHAIPPDVVAFKQRCPHCNLLEGDEKLFSQEA